MSPFVFPRSTPEEEGIDSQGILDFVDAVSAARLELHSLMIVRHGKVVAEGWWSPYDAQRPHLLYSLSKSFTATAVGMAVEEGRLKLDDQLISFLPDEAPANPNEHLAAMTVHHLLSMNTGQITEPVSMFEHPESWVKGFFEVPVVVPPGSHFLYNTPATYMLAAILAKVTGETLVEYLTPRLFEPLGIANPTWQMSPQGINVGGFGLSVTTEDIARFGQLYLQKGMWQGKQLVPEAWVAQASSIQSVNGYPSTGADWAQGYGYQFWRGQHGVYRGDGAFGQYCIVMQAQDTVIALTAAVPDMQFPLDLVWKHLLSAIEERTLPAAPDAAAKLAERLASLAIAPVKGEPSSEVAASVLGAWYKLAENEFGVKRVRLAQDPKGWYLLELETPRGLECTPIGYGEWVEGDTRLYSGPPRFLSSRTVASGAWFAPYIFTAHIRLVETPTYAMIGLRFGGDKVVFGNRLNLNMGPTIFPEIIGTRE